MQPDVWSQRAIIVVDLALLNCGVAQSIAKAFDPDEGGEYSFDAIRAGKSRGDASHAVCDVLLTPQTASTMQSLARATPDVLASYVSAQYATRWPDRQTPTVDDCALFLASARIFVGEAEGIFLDDVLTQLCLSIVQAQE